ncbi:uncharacterized protein LOC134779216 [Penaeus indicus]|uniref:uncharacterized protein LOC134779216 n=1 Tax=Penaeus indicus TaxID=29960 RepID=UPI00300CAE04
MVTRRGIRRLLPVLCALLLLRIYVIKLRDGHGDDEDSGLHSWHESTSNEVKPEMKILPGPSETSQSSIVAETQEVDILLERGKYQSHQNVPNHKEELEGQGNAVNMSDRTDFISSHDHSPSWMRITDDLHTYSGFWDSRPYLPEGPVARVLGIMRYKKELMQPGRGFKVSSWVKDNMLNCSCVLWYTDKDVPSQGTLKAFVYEEGLKDYVGTFLLCYPLSTGEANKVDDSMNTNFRSNNQEKIPYAVSIMPTDRQNSSYNMIYLRREEETANASETSSAVCVRPLFGPYNNLVGMAQFLSYYSSVLKVKNFYFYDLAINDDVLEYLLKVATLGVNINILHWNVPTTDWEKLWDLGSLTALNDCVYRTSKKHAYVAVVDVDEFIVPQMKGLTLEGVYKKVISHKVGNHGDAALIRNIFFCYEFENTKDDAIDINELPIFRYIHREDRVWPSKQRSKMIVVPAAVVALGHHMIHHFAKENLKNHGAPNTIAVLRHYRTCKEVNMGTHATGPRVLDQKIIKDASMMKFKSSVMKSRVLQLYLQFVQYKMTTNKTL